MMSTLLIIIGIALIAYYEFRYLKSPSDKYPLSQRPNFPGALLLWIGLLQVIGRLLRSSTDGGAEGYPYDDDFTGDGRALVAGFAAAMIIYWGCRLYEYARKAYSNPS